MRAGLLLPRGSGPAELARAGQWSRFARHFLRPYVAAFERVALLVEEPETVWRSTGEDGVEVRRLERRRGCWSASAFADLDVVRAFQAPDLYRIPAQAPQAAATFGYDYARFARLQSAIPGPRALLAAARARAGARRAALLFAPAAFLEARARALAPRARLEPLPNGVDLEAFRPPERLRAPSRALCVARLARQKNLPTLLRALARLPAARRPRLTLVGDGALRPRLARLARRLGVEAEFAGVVPHEDLPSLYAAHDLFLLPSLAEGQSKALLEAMACAMACVVSDCEGNRSLVEDGGSGWLHPARDPEALAETLARVCSLPEAAQFRVRRSARLAAEDRHGLRTLVEREVGWVRELARQRSAAEPPRPARQGSADPAAAAAIARPSQVAGDMKRKCG